MKQELRQYLRQSLQEYHSDPHHFREGCSDLFNDIFDPHEDWEELKEKLQIKFPGGLSPQELKETFSLKESVITFSLFQLLQERTGVCFTPKAVEAFFRNPHEAFDESSIDEIRPIVKSLHSIEELAFHLGQVAQDRTKNLLEDKNSLGGEK